MAPTGKLSIADMDHKITFFQNSLSLHPRFHLEHITGVYNLIEAQFARYRLSQEKEDLDKCILHCTETIFHPLISQVGLTVNVIERLCLLACALLERSEKFKQPHDIKYSIEYLRYLRGLPLDLDSFHVPRNDVTTSLIRALAVKVTSETGDATYDIKEMVVLCRELLTSNLSADFPIGALGSLNQAVNADYRSQPIELLDEVIECLRDAVKVGPPVMLVLANTLFARFAQTHSNDDYDDATVLLERILDPNQPGEDELRGQALLLATQLAYARSTFFRQNPQYLEETISRLRTLLSSPSIDERHRLYFTHILADEVRGRSDNYSLAESLEEANSYTSQISAHSSSQSLEEPEELFSVSGAVRESCSMSMIAEKIQYLKRLLSITPPGTGRHKKCLRYLAEWYESKFDRTDDISDIEESIKYNRLALNAAHSTDGLRVLPLGHLSNGLFRAFKKTNKTNYLDEAITLVYEILELKSARYIHPEATWRLVSYLLIREKLLGRREDRHEAVRLISKIIDNEYVGEPSRFLAACRWAILARSISHPTTLTAYKSAMSLMQKSLSFAPTVSSQHTRLVIMGEDCQTMPLDYASFQIILGQFEEAVETLEQGRALLWSEMRGFRTSAAQLIEDLPLQKRFVEINQELEVLTISVTPSGRLEMEDGVAQGRDFMDPFGRLVLKQQKLVEEREALISEIQGRPGLSGFLKAPSFTTLFSAASRGPVIIINHCEWRSDILILCRTSLCCIPTTNDFYVRAIKLRDELVSARKHGLDSDEYQDTLCSVLKGLYDLVGEPVIKGLHMLGIAEQSRIWFCPTSVFCSLPLHAMGPIPSGDTLERYFSDLYIPSYTPSLSALVESRRENPQILKMPSILLVAQPDHFLPGVKGEIKVIRALKSRITVADLVSSEATPSAVVAGLRSSPFVHFACHGLLETGKPFEASFKLHGGERLTLLDIVRSRLPDAEFAFLSCCHAAEITENSVADEALHLTAAMQYCGFRSVVGTMWEMADTDGRDLAKSFYKSIFSGEETGVPYYERSAGALRDATQKLRGKRGITLERWVNFVHYGA